MTHKASGGDGSALEWIKSSYSSNDGPECVEVAAVPGAVRIRDSKDVCGLQLEFAPTAWENFVAYASES
ncbi:MULTISPECIES: DUF397 domain-containing protein [unclassified Streptomyces]|uniref:DUF397 domain-containing protein n=1 Tax=unclassified Streptomyces TaxID=2593676 RepID=UPI00225638E2|nr:MULTISPECIES: DUF397 domain-containing protein [unclassified Streptomyces]WSP56940.1 DUF397 domain-containing protein [Streptomyces sp. NBC_01241]WSU22343.1 DUF397 domain-containing protein [Streptomyces sp. NBC_01108]MCX4788725.1 DUF397 domain-containing protein [Streptomyces sp. NBC_01221]MCX4795527.1 DUF397 domain-containing protein [Streptomyces sp. NBC_01242]WSJ36816.1 DUF397 domain-containing protein [Streptomyces sp. NBC_01321]